MGAETQFNQSLAAVPGHLTDVDNPHGVTFSQTGAAAAEHTHSQYAEKVTNAASGNLAVFGSGGSLADGGLAFSVVNGVLRVSYTE